MMKRLLLPFVAGAMMLGAAVAEPSLKEFHKLIPGTTVESLKPSEIDGLYELKVKESPVPIFISNDGKYMIEGQAVDLVNGINISERYQHEGNKKLIATLKEEDMIIYPAKNEKQVVTIFTDIECPFCQMLHKEMDAYNDAGITIRYIAFPRMGVNSPAARDLESIWCSAPESRPQLMTDAMLNSNIPKASCKRAPIAQQYQLGVEMGIQGTPAIITEEGAIIGGYVPAGNLSKMLGL